MTSDGEKIDTMIAGLDDWRGPMMARVRQIFRDADAEMIEEWKWMGSPAWSKGGLIAVADAHKAKVKITFAHGAKLADPKAIFNGKDTGATRRSIDIFSSDGFDADGLAALIGDAMAYNLAHLKKNAGKTA